MSGRNDSQASQRPCEVGDSKACEGRYKTEVIHRRSWRGLQNVALATLERLDCFNHKRLLGLIDDSPPAEAEANYYQQTRELAMAA